MINAKKIVINTIILDATTLYSDDLFEIKIPCFNFSFYKFNNIKEFNPNTELFGTFNLIGKKQIEFINLSTSTNITLTNMDFVIIITAYF